MQICYKIVDCFCSFFSRSGRCDTWKSCQHNSELLLSSKMVFSISLVEVLWCSKALGTFGLQWCSQLEVKCKWFTWRFIHWEQVTRILKFYYRYVSTVKFFSDGSCLIFFGTTVWQPVDMYDRCVYITVFVLTNDNLIQSTDS